jgi:amino-acid N-acetyltransferase
MVASTIIQDQPALEKLQQFLLANKLPHQDIDVESSNTKMFLGYYDEVGELIGSGELEFYGDAALLRSLTVKENQRGKNLGKKIVDDLVSQARKASINNIFLLTETAKDFFEKKGFKTISRNAVPEHVKASPEFTHVCPKSAICMFYQLTT